MLLFVDDFPDAVQAICGVIARKGYPCRCVGGGKEALQAIRSHPPDKPLLVVLDHMMNGMDGIQVIQALRNDPKTANVPVIMYSAGFSREARQESIELGVSVWLVKADDIPTTIRTIISAYEETVAHWRGAGDISGQQMAI
jgi:CheY-like chemotaxis protein